MLPFYRRIGMHLLIIALLTYFMIDYHDVFFEIIKIYRTTNLVTKFGYIVGRLASTK